MTPETKPEEIPETVMKAARDAYHSAFVDGEATQTAVYEAIARAIMAYSQRDQWKDMDSAPKDGTEILGYGQSSYNGKKYAAGRHVVWFDEGKWWGRDPDTLVGIDITHWQHLPTPPKSEA